MALAATTQWDVRTTGDDTNGGAFNTASSGTDYSQQDAAQITYTDLVIGGTNTQLTSAANPFTAAHVGNLVNVTSLFYLVPIVTAAMDHWILGNPVSLTNLAGMAAILAGLAVVFDRGRRRSDTMVRCRDRPSRSPSA